MCYCGNFVTDGFFNCCQEQMTKNQEAKQKKEWERQVSKGYFENNKKTFVESAIEGAKNIMQKGEKNKVASAYMPNIEERPAFIPPPPKAGPSIKPANETPREELLQRDVGILFEENRKLKEQNEILLERASILLEQNKKLFDSFQRLYKQNELLTEKVGKPNADM